MQSSESILQQRECIQIPQDSAAVIHRRTPQQIHGLYTEGLASCAVIVVKGEKGVALIHESGKLSSNSIQKVLKKIGNIQFWTIALHPGADRVYKKLKSDAYEEKYGNKDIFNTRYEKIYQVMETILGTQAHTRYQKPSIDKPYYEAENRSLFVDRNGNIHTTFPRFYRILQAPYSNFRKSINQLNNACLEKDQTLDCDFQYNGKKFTSIPRLILPLNRIEKNAQGDQIISLFLQNYKWALEDSKSFKKNEILTKYSMNSFEQALRRAAWGGDFSDILFLLEELKIDPNTYGKSKKLALHFAVINGNCRIKAYKKVLRVLYNSQISLDERLESEGKDKCEIARTLCRVIRLRKEEEQLSLISQATKTKEIKEKCISRINKKILKETDKYQKVIDLLLEYGANKDHLDSEIKKPVDYDTQKLFSNLSMNSSPLATQAETKESLYIGQDAAAVILFDKTPPHIAGIWTDALQCCLAIIIKGSKGLALVHESGALSEDSIKNILKRVGAIKFWAIIFNPNADADMMMAFPSIYKAKFANKGIFESRVKKIRVIMDELLGDQSKEKYKTPNGKLYFETMSKFAFFDRKGDIYVDPLLIPYKLKAIDNDNRLRDSINKLNSACGMGKYLECDLQYDGETFTDLPLVSDSPEQIQKKIDSVEFTIRHFYDKYKQELKSSQINKIQQKYGVQTLDAALRQTAAKGNMADMSFLIEETGVDIDAQGKDSRKTALHFAVEKGVGLLLKYKQALSSLESKQPKIEEKEQKIKGLDLLNTYGVKDRGSALCQAILQEAKDHICIFLAEAQMNPNIRENYKQMLKKKINEEKDRYQKIISFLLSHQARMDIKDKFSKIPYDYNTENLFQMN